MKGKIVIKENKVYFEPEGLEKPDKRNYSARNDYASYQKVMVKYEASKQLIEVSNVIKGSKTGIWYYYATKRNDIIIDIVDGESVKINQPCKAEVENNIATIVKIN